MIYQAMNVTKNVSNMINVIYNPDVPPECVQNKRLMSHYNISLSNDITSEHESVIKVKRCASSVVYANLHII